MGYVINKTLITVWTGDRHNENTVTRSATVNESLLE